MTLVFVHGAAASSDFWEFQRPFFPAAQFLNLPGHTSRRPQQAGAAIDEPTDSPLPSIAAYADWLIRFIESQDLPNVRLVGHSMGGAVALAVALQHPKWLTGLVLSSSGAKLPMSPELLQLIGSDHQAAVNWIVEHSFAPGANRYRVEGVRRQLLRTPSAILAADYQVCAEFDLSDRVRAGEIQLPTVLVYGSNDRLIEPVVSHFLADSISGSTSVMINGAGHMAPLEEPENWAEAVKPKLNRVGKS